MALFQAGSQTFLFSTTSRSALGPIRLPTQCAQGLSSWRKVAKLQG
jgi:hypothetical protein